MSLKNRFSLFSFDEGVLTNVEEVIERLKKYPYKNLARTNRPSLPISFCGADEIVDEQNFDATTNRVLFNAIFQTRVINKNLIKKVLEERIASEFPHLIGATSGEEYMFLKDEVTGELSERFLVKTSLTQIGLSFKNKLLYIFARESDALTIAKKMADILDLKNVRLMTLANHINHDGVELKEDFQAIMSELLLKALSSQTVDLEEVSLTQNEANFKVTSDTMKNITDIILDEKTLVIDSLSVKLKEGSTEGFWHVKLDKNNPGKFWLNPKFSSKNSREIIVDFIEYDEGVNRLLSESRVNVPEDVSISQVKEKIINEIMGLEFEE